MEKAIKITKGNQLFWLTYLEVAEEKAYQAYKEDSLKMDIDKVFGRDAWIDAHVRAMVADVLGVENLKDPEERNMIKQLVQELREIRSNSLPDD